MGDDGVEGILSGARSSGVGPVLATRGSMRRTIPIIAVLLLLATALTAPRGARAQELTREQGQGLIGLGVAFQVVGLGVAVADIAQTGSTLPFRIPFSLASIPIAPLTAEGFRVALTDGTRAGDLRGYGIGMLEGALYSGLVATAGLAALGAATWRCRDQDCNVPLQIYILPFAWPHAFVAVGLLIPGLILVAESNKADAITPTGSPSRAARPRLSVAPAAGPGYQGLVLQGRF